MPAGLDARVDDSSWTWPPVFRWLAEQGPVPRPEMLRTFNCGVGMVVVLAPAAVAVARAVLAERGVAAWVLGTVVPAVSTAAPFDAM
jgi:phosphoribosylformylglycinamidine cyclo-ligase